ncbi:hypothetical protein BOTBODRAFT_179056 [Botryobasidium botryosum FD-172 SS1]|uniref:t-SNARE coiled-coil homology domain-containing protein n=1 Tax=Botryobasidium botryosum (strain FD-172 SS1) TaxID=930990 RepID=A0A067MCQ9_BOTB1|nr:hypothetical protein BOTBODRAFT_179056 [Botryobasidium botryosum FD-172 SS1]
MSKDPYHEVQNEIQTSLQTASTLRASYLRIRSTAREDSEELDWARNELKATLAALDADLEDLEESVRIVEETGGRLFGIEDVEVLERRQYVSYVRNEIENMRREVSGLPPAVTPGPRGAPPAYSPPAPAEDDQAAWAHQEQQMIVETQDRTLSSISGTLTTLAEQAGLMGREIGEHNEMLGDLEANVDRTENKLNGAMKRMQKFIRQTEETKSGWCIGILIVVLFILLLAVIIV